MTANNETFRQKIIESVYENNKYDEGKKILIEWWNSNFADRYKVESIEEDTSSIYSSINEIVNGDITGLDEESKDVIISIAGIISKIIFYTESMDNHYDKAFQWLEIVRPLAKEYKNEFTTWFWNRYIDLITYTGRKVHIMEIPVESQSDMLKIAYCDYLYITNQGGIKEIRRILTSIENDDPRIHIMKNKTLCNIYAESPSQRNNKQIKDYAKKIMQYSSNLSKEEEQKNIKYYWYLKSATYSSNNRLDFYSLPDEETYKKMTDDIINLINYYITVEKETIKAAIECISLINFAVKNVQYEDSTLFILWFLSIVEGYNHEKALDIYYPVYKNIMEILLSVSKNSELITNGRIANRFNKVHKMFFNESSIDNWEKIDYILRKKVLPTSPLGKVTQRLIEDYFDMAYEEINKMPVNSK